METSTVSESHCPDCLADLEHCHEASIEHADGFTECLDVQCSLGHELHTWQLPCSVFDPPCACAPEELELIGITGRRLAVAA